MRNEFFDSLELLFRYLFSFLHPKLIFSCVSARDKSIVSNLTVPVGSGKNKKSWEQLQQETETGEEVKDAGVQVQVILTSQWLTETYTNL